MWRARLAVFAASTLAVLSVSCTVPSDGKDQSARSPSVDASADTTAPVATLRGSGYAPGELAGAKWSLVSLRGRDLVEETEITMNFDGDAMRGTAGCNSHGSNSARVEGGAIDVGADDLTTIGCKGPVGRQESTYLEALDVSRTYRLQGDRLKLRNQSNRTILLFEKEAR